MVRDSANVIGFRPRARARAQTPLLVKDGPFPTRMTHLPNLILPSSYVSSSSIPFKNSKKGFAILLSFFMGPALLS